MDKDKGSQSRNYRRQLEELLLGWNSSRNRAKNTVKFKFLKKGEGAKNEYDDYLNGSFRNGRRSGLVNIIDLNFNLYELIVD